MSNGLIMLQTTNNVFNMTLYDLVVPQSVPAWIRVRVANQMSEKSSDWGAWLNMSNSGTVIINNEWSLIVPVFHWYYPSLCVRYMLGIAISVQYLRYCNYYVVCSYVEKDLIIYLI